MHYPVEVPPEEESQDVETEEDAVRDFNREDETPGPVGRSVNQADLVRRALAAGHEKPAAGVAYIKSQYGVDIDPKYYSVGKSQMKKREGEAASAPAAPAKPRAAATPAPIAAPRPAAPAAPGVIPPTLFDDLKRLKEIKERYGPDEFGKLVDFLG